MTFKPVFRYSKADGLFRLFRVIWKHGKGAGHGAPDNYHGVFKIALSKRPFFRRWRKDDKVITAFFVRLTFEKSFGGVPV